jgi:hypothetical protein
MRSIAVCLFCLMFHPGVHAQLLKKYPVGNSGCSIYSFCELKFDLDYSEDSSKVYTAECTKDGISYGVICVKLLNPTDDLQVAEDLMLQYIEYLKASFNITKMAGIGKGLHLADNENTRGVLDYWEDKDKNNWKYKSWTDGKFIGFIYAFSQKELPEQKINIFLEGFRLPGM